MALTLHLKYQKQYNPHVCKCLVKNKKNCNGTHINIPSFFPPLPSSSLSLSSSMSTQGGEEAAMVGDGGVMHLITFRLVVVEGRSDKG